MKKCSNCKLRKKRGMQLKSLKKESNKSSKNNRTRLWESKSKKLSKRPSGKEQKNWPAGSLRLDASRRRMKLRGNMNSRWRRLPWSRRWKSYKSKMKGNKLSKRKPWKSGEKNFNSENSKELSSEKLRIRKELTSRCWNARLRRWK